MSMYDFFVEHGFAIELLISVIIFTWRIKRRDSFILRALCSILVLFCVSVIWSILPLQNVWGMSLRYILFFAVCLIGVMFCFRIRRSQAGFLVTAAGVTQHFVFKAGQTCVFLTYVIFGANSWSDTIGYPVFVSLFLGLCYIFFARNLNKSPTSGMKDSTVTMLMIGMLLCTNLFQNLFDAYSQGISVKLYAVFGFFDLVNGLFLMALMYAMNNQDKIQQNNAILSHMLHQQKEQMGTSKETMELINIKYHDLKNHISMLGNRMTQEEIDELNNSIAIYNTMAQTGNEALDILIAEKSLICEQKRIQFDYIADGSSLSFMKSSDIYSLFGNALDNAIEAVSKIQDGERRYIGMRVSIEKGMLMIRLENRYDGVLDFDDGLPQTTKKDKHYHGFGMKSVRLITEKYHGYLSIKADHGLFVLNMLLPIPK